MTKEQLKEIRARLADLEECGCNNATAHAAKWGKGVFLDVGDLIAHIDQLESKLAVAVQALNEVDRETFEHNIDIKCAREALAQIKTLSGELSEGGSK